MASDDVREIKSKLDIVEVVGDYVALRKNGQTHWGRCPFHNEKTPSFSVSQERQTFHCFGCGKGGDIFTFIMEMEHLEFRETLEILAERAGVKLQKLPGRSPLKSSGASNIQVIALDFFKKSLEGAGGEAARSYLSRRSINSDVSSRFEIGWAPSSWDALRKHLEICGFNAQQIMDSGLVTQGTKGTYDRFRGRIIFPIYNVSDRLIGFGGRILDGDEAKYLNSPESPLFNKRNNLYLLNKAKMSARTEKHIILVEGYMDAIRAHLAGFTNTVASLGTALTDAQAALIKRVTGLCYICYDSDSAGQEAALRGMYVLQKHGVAVKIMRLSGAKDPDELLLLSNGVEDFKKAIESAVPLPVYHAVIRSADIADPEKSYAAREELLDGLASLSLFDLQPYFDKIGQELGIFAHELKNEIESRQEKIRGRESHRIPEDDFESITSDEDDNDTPDKVECQLCSLIWGNEEVRALLHAEAIVPFVKSPIIKDIVVALLSGERPDTLEKRWRTMGESSGLNVIALGNGLVDKEGLSSDNASDLLRILHRRFAEKRASYLQNKLKKNIATADEVQECQDLTRKLKGGNFGA